MKIIAGMLLTPFMVFAAPSTEIPQTSSISVKNTNSADPAFVLNEKGMAQLSKGISDADPKWIQRVAGLAPQLQAGNADRIAVALAEALPKKPAEVLAAMVPAFAGRDKVCTMPFTSWDNMALARYYRQTESALKKLGAPAKECLEQLNTAIDVFKQKATDQQKSMLNRKPLTPQLLQKAFEQQGVEKTISTLSIKQVQEISAGIAGGNRDWLMVADSMIKTDDAPTHSMLTFSLASALMKNPGDVLTVAKGHIEIDTLCGMPFPNASKDTMMQYYQRTRSALLKIRRRGVECLQILDDQQALMINAPVQPHDTP